MSEDDNVHQRSLSPGARRLLRGAAEKEFRRTSHRERYEDVLKTLRGSVRNVLQYAAVGALIGFSYLVGDVLGQQAGVERGLARADSLSAAVERQRSRADSLERVIDAAVEERVSDVRHENELLLDQQAVLLAGENYCPDSPPMAIDSLSAPLGSYVFEVDKPHQRFRLWQRAHYVLVADVPCSTGRNRGEKGRRGDGRTPAGYASVVSVQDSERWLHEGRFAYGKRFARLNFGSWDAAGSYHPRGHCSIGIHGTDEEWKLGSEASEGCVRLPNVFLEECVRSGIISEGISGFIVPYDTDSLSSSQAGVGRDRLRKSFIHGGRNYLKENDTSQE